MTEDTLFALALEQPTAAARAAFLAEACGDNAALHAAVESLLEAHDQAGAFLQQPAPAQVAARLNPPGADTSALSAETPRHGTPIPEHLDVTEELAFLAPPSRPGSIGRLGPYEIDAIVGRGGMGVVLKACDPMMQRVVALKVLAPQLAASRTARERFLREARAASVIHDNVVTIHAVAEEHGIPYLVLQFVHGVSLQQKLERDGPFALPELVRIGHQTACGLAAAHAQGLVHRDIKLTNLLLEDETSRLKITDFGVARAARDARLTQTGVIVGTPLYMSPEQAHGTDVDHRSDLFSLGCVLYALCTGVPPFQAENTLAVLKRICEEAPRPLRQLNPQLPAWLVAAIERLLAKDRAARFQSAAEVAELFARHRDAPHDTPSPRSPWRRRGVALVLAGVLGAACLCLLLLERRPAPVEQRPRDDREYPGLVPHPPRLAGGRRWQLQTIQGRAHIHSIAWSPDSQALACSDAGGVVRIVETAARELRLRQILVGHQHRLSSVAWHRSGRLATASHDQSVRVWEPDGRLAALLAGHTAWVESVAWEPGGRRLVSSARDNTVRLWDVATDQAQVIHQDTAPVQRLCWSPDGRYVAGTLGQTILVWRADGTRQGSFEHGHDIWALAWAPDGRLASSGVDLKVRLWRPEGKKAVAVLPIPARRLAWHPDGDRLAAVAEAPAGQVQLWKADGTALGALCRLCREVVHDLAWSPDGTQLGVAGVSGNFLVWRRDGAREWRGADPVYRAASLAWSPDGTRLVTGDRLAVWAADGSNVQCLGQEAAAEVYWSHDGQWLGFLAAGEGRMRLCAPDGAPGPECPVPGSPVYSPDGQRLLVLADKNREFQVWQHAGTPGPRAPAGPRGAWTSGIAWDPAGQRLAITQLGLALLWELDAAPRLIADLAIESVGAPAWSPDRQWLAISNGTRIVLHRADGTPLRRWLAHSAQMSSLAWSPDSRWLASGAEGELRLWQPGGEPGPAVAGPQHEIRRLAWSRAGQLASITENGTLNVWDRDLQPRWVGLLVGAQAVALDAAGRFLVGDDAVLDRHLVYSVETETGALELLTPAAFRRASQ